MYANYRKCVFVKEHIQYLGHIITKDGIVFDPEKINTITEGPVRKDVIYFFKHYHEV